MTFRYKGHWSKDAGNNDAPCIPLNASKIQFNDVGNVSTGKRIPSQTIGPIDTPWQVDLYARDATGKQESPEHSGIRLRSTDTCPNEEGNKGKGVTLITEPGQYSSFYPNNDAADDEDGETSRKRYHDKSQTCTRPPSLTGDADSCEQIFNIYFNTAFIENANDVKTAAASAFRCRNGECTIVVQ